MPHLIPEGIERFRLLQEKLAMGIDDLMDIEVSNEQVRNGNAVEEQLDLSDDLDTQRSAKRPRSGSSSSEDDSEHVL
jgi:hypothetical protein